MTQRRTNSRLPAPSILDSLLPVVAGAFATILVLRLLNLGAVEVWAPFARGGPGLIKALALSALVGGVVAARLSGRIASGPLSASAPALGWALWGVSLHGGAQGQYLEVAGGGFSEGQAEVLAFVNAISQSLCVALGLLLASGVGWLWAWRRDDSLLDEAPVTDDDLDGNGLKSFGTAFFYPLSTVIGGALLLAAFGALASPLGNPPAERVPSNPSIAAACGVLTMLALFATTSLTRRAFRALGSVGDIALAPVAIAVVALGWSMTGFPLLAPAALLIWQTSALEMASWGALGASLGYHFAQGRIKVR